MSAHKDFYIKRCLETIHFNKKYPQFHNVYIPDKKMREVAVFTSKKFELKNKTEVINDIITNNQGHLDDFINRVCQFLYILV